MKNEILLEFVRHMPGHKNSKGESAPWVIISHETGKVLSSHKSKAAAKKHLQQMHIFKEKYIAIITEDEYKYLKENTNKIILFHTSNPIFRNSIFKKGLIPSVGESYKMHYDESDNLEKFVFLSKSPYDTTYDDDVWAVDVSDIKLKHDPDKELTDAYVTNVSIDLSKLFLIYKGHIGKNSTLITQNIIKKSVNEFMKKL